MKGYVRVLVASGLVLSAFATVPPAYAGGPPSESDVEEAVGEGPLRHVRCGPANDDEGGYICSFRKDQNSTLFGQYFYTRMTEGWFGWKASPM